MNRRKWRVSAGSILQAASNQVTFSHSADTFLRDVTWLWLGDAMSTTQTAGGVQYDVVLSRQ
jgi:hypothetical protein